MKVHISPLSQQPVWASLYSTYLETDDKLDITLSPLLAMTGSWIIISFKTRGSKGPKLDWDQSEEALTLPHFSLDSLSPYCYLTRIKSSHWLSMSLYELEHGYQSMASPPLYTLSGLPYGHQTLSISVCGLQLLNEWADCNEFRWPTLYPYPACWKQISTVHVTGWIM